MRVHLVDGTYELFRAYYGAPPAQVNGREVGAVRGLVRSLLSLLAEREVTHVACAFDHVIESFRNGLYAGYKTGDGVPADLMAQFPLAEEAARALGVVVWPMVEFEADDALAAAAARYAADRAVEQVVVCTPDKDLAQTVRGRRVVRLDRRKREVLDEDGVRAKYGVPPSCIPDWLALVGDSADGYPGIPRWGEKSAAAVLARYETIEAIPEDGRRWECPVRGALALAESLNRQRADAVLFRTLATLRTDAPIAEDLDDLRWRGGRADLLADVGRVLGEPDLVTRMPLLRAD